MQTSHKCLREWGALTETLSFRSIFRLSSQTLGICILSSALSIVTLSTFYK